MATLSPQEYLDTMREAGSAMGLAARALDHADGVMTRHITDTVVSSQVRGLAGGDGRVIRATRDVLQSYKDRGKLTPALEAALTALNSADSAFRMLATNEASTADILYIIQDAEIQLAIARRDFRQELLDHGVPEAQADELMR